MKRLLAIGVVACLASSALSADLLEFTLANPKETAGWTKVDFHGQALWLKPASELSSVHIASAELEWSEPLPPELAARIKERSPNAIIDTERRPGIRIKFTEKGTALLNKVTTAHVGDRLVILHQGNVLSAPVITEPITGGVASIMGPLTETEAKELVRNLNQHNESNKVTPANGASPRR